MTIKTAKKKGLLAQSVIEDEVSSFICSYNLVANLLLDELERSFSKVEINISKEDEIFLIANRKKFSFKITYSKEKDSLEIDISQYADKEMSTDLLLNPESARHLMELSVFGKFISPMGEFCFVENRSGDTLFVSSPDTGKIELVPYLVFLQTYESIAPDAFIRLKKKPVKKKTTKKKAVKKKTAA